MSIRDPDQVEMMLDAVLAEYGQIDTLINNAGGQFPQNGLDLGGSQLQLLAALSAAHPATPIVVVYFNGGVVSSPWTMQNADAVLEAWYPGYEGGAAIAAVCDIRIAAANARFGFPIAKTLGNCLSMQNYGRLAALIGPARVIDLIYTARLVEAEEAKAIGLVSELLPDHAALQARAAALAQIIAGHAPLTLRATKEAMRRLREAARDVHGDDLVTMCFTSEDFRQGVENFLAKRPMQWQGR
jgi:NAD(P)-dependent dehydrogenase (short-subunit alcohol dehydrogenase family)